MNASSSWPRRTSTPLPLAITGPSSKSSAEKAATMLANTANKRIFSFIESKFYHAHVADVLVLRQLIEQCLRRHAVEIQHRECLTTRLIAAQAHTGDVHAVLAHQRADVNDHARLVFIVQQEHHATRDNFRR